MPESGGMPLRGGSPEPIAGKCAAQLQHSRPPRYCMRWPLHGKKRCRQHGGLSLSGVDHPGFKHGRYSEKLQAVMPKGLAAHVALARESQSLHMHDQIALIDGKVLELFEQMSAGDGPIAWLRADKASAAVEQALLDFNHAVQAPASPDKGAKITAAAADMEAAVALNRAVTREGVALGQQWHVLTEQIEIRRSLVDTEIKIQKADSERMDRGVVLAMLANLLDMIDTQVTDLKTKENIIAHVRGLLGR